MPKPSAEHGRYASLRRPLVAMSELLQGKEIDRHRIADLAGTELAGADRILFALKTYVRGVVEERDSRPRKLRFDPSFLGDQPTLPVAIAACFGASLSTLFEGTAYSAGMRNALGYVVRLSRRRKIFENLDRKFFFVRQGGEQFLDDADHAGRFDEYIDALLNERRVRIRYRDFDGKAKTYLVEPLSVAIYDHQLYALAQVDGGERRLFRFARVESLNIETSRFVYPSRSEFEPGRIFHDSLGAFISDTYPVARVVLRLSARWATYARSHRWHSTQDVEADRDGGVLVKWRVRLCPELEQLVLSFGEHAEVLEPTELRATIGRRLSGAAARYKVKRG